MTADGQPAETAAERIERLGYELGSITALLEEADAVWFVDREAARLRVRAALRIARADTPVGGGGRGVRA